MKVTAVECPECHARRRSDVADCPRCQVEAEERARDVVKVDPWSTGRSAATCVEVACHVLFFRGRGGSSRCPTCRSERRSRQRMAQKSRARARRSALKERARPPGGGGVPGQSRGVTDVKLDERQE